MQRLNRTSEGVSVSVYKDQVATKEEIAEQVQMLSVAFPNNTDNTTAGFYALLTMCMLNEGFTKQRAKDAVLNVIKHFKYKQFNIADIINFDKAVKIYTYQEYCKGCTQGIGEDFAFYGEVEGTKYWYRKSELINSKL